MRHKVASLSILIAAAISATFVGSGYASADSYNQNKIIDDAIFDNANSMSAGQIDTFLNTFPNSCISPSSGFRAIEPTGYNPNDGYQYGGYATAGQVIYDASRAYGLNPQVLLVVLQKEQSLVAGGVGFCNNGDESKYAAAVGYGCPDSGTTHNYTGVSLYQRNGVVVSSTGNTCVNSATKVGFSQQLIRAAWLLKFGEQRAKGNVNWAVMNGNWNNSDDPQTCYGGPMTQGTFQRCPSGATTYYDGYATIDSTAVHIESGATATLYWYTPHFHGNQIFFSLFTSWFGSTYVPFAFKSPTDSTVYLYVNGFKIIASAMGLLQDYGISPQSIQIISQSELDSIPSPTQTDGVSANLGSIVKSPSDSDPDGGSIYYISIGKRYQLTSMQQFADFGFSTAAISYLPLAYIQSLPSGGSLSNFIQSPYGSVFQVTGGAKKLILDNSSYKTLNPSDYVTQVSYFAANNIVTAVPVSSRDFLMKYPNNDTVYLLQSGSYYRIPDYDTYNCWGFGSNLDTPLYTLPDSSYVPTISVTSNLSCMVKISSVTYLMSAPTKYALPTEYGFGASITEDPNVSAVATKLPTSTNTLKQYVKGSSSSAIWYLSAGTRRIVPTYNDYVYLGLGSNSFTVINESSLEALSSTGIKLGTGSLVKTSGDAAVYVINGDSRVLYDSSDNFVAYKNSWRDIVTYDTILLNQYYPTNGVVVSKYLYDPATSNTYLVDTGGCYKIDSGSMANYGQTASALSASQTYPVTIFRSLDMSSCVPASVFVKSSGQALVYSLSGGAKSPVVTWSKLQSLSSQQNPYVISLSPSTLATFPTGTPLR